MRIPSGAKAQLFTHVTARLKAVPLQDWQCHEISSAIRKTSQCNTGHRVRAVRTVYNPRSSCDERAVHATDAAVRRGQKRTSPCARLLSPRRFLRAVL